jgi:hypothetical protein
LEKFISIIMVCQLAAASIRVVWTQQKESSLLTALAVEFILKGNGSLQNGTVKTSTQIAKVAEEISIIIWMKIAVAVISYSILMSGQQASGL